MNSIPKMKYNLKSNITTPTRALTSDDLTSSLSQDFTNNTSHAFSNLTVQSMVSSSSTHINTQYSCSQQAGYKLINNEILPIHDENEDVYFTDGKLFILADGHGGRNAPVFFVKESKIRVQALITSQIWNLDEASQRYNFEQLFTSLFVEMDEDFLELKRNEYALWMSEKGPKPIDDGCTLTISLLLNNYFINANVGDSRAVLGALLKGKNLSAPEPIKNYKEKYDSHLFLLEPGKSNAEISTFFASCDHNMTHPIKINHIAKHGGNFITNQSPIKFHKVASPETRGYRPYSELIGARIYNPISPLPYLTNRRTLNLSSTMGDLLFKPVISSKPDIRFVKLEVGVSYVLCMGTDGVWDHLELQTSQDSQNTQVLGYVWDLLKREKMSFVAQHMVDREKGLYVKERQHRVDDVTFIVAKFDV